MKSIFKFRPVHLLAGAMLVVLSSCNDFLEKEPLNAVSELVVWNDVPLVEAFVNETYATMRTGWPNHSSLSVTSDESFARERDGAHLIQRGQITPSNLGHLNWTWAHYYTIITKSNIFFDKLQGADLDALKAIDEKRVNRMIGEMKFLRAFSYFRLSAFFGGVPLIENVFGLDDEFGVEKSSYEEITAYVVKELDEAAALLPLAHDAANKGRITKGACLAIKSRALLYAASPLHNTTNDKGKWQQAADAARAVIDLKLYALYPEYGKVFTVPFNSEVIWEKVMNNDVLRQETIERYFFPNGSGGHAVTVPTHQQAETYETKNGLLPKDDPTYKLEKFWENRDPRFYETILYDGAPWKGRQIEVFLPKGMDSNQGNEGWNASYTGYYTKKFVNESVNGPGSTNSSSPNWPYARYAEILLNYAEALYNLGDEAGAREYINQVRARQNVNMPAVKDTGAKLLARIQNERRVELYLEEHRFFDIRRWKLTFPASTSLLKMNVELAGGKKTYSFSPVIQFALPENTYLLPIPQDEINKSAVLKQNPGY
ncbi:RagB/SusD family nutrient uptake outer membrane protein [Dyadobacter aurulentus]|uniref:RagB/SusD family nutrient uptake outer membrane protein n=1 Tax=Dyadobacter sp. UC 10 TaxID=2605428 RepID=UPI001788B0F3|nr:RagB/SusD family nutrient uptake outer membrane protein [Dyadobacter sp. UC 10]